STDAVVNLSRADPEDELGASGDFVLHATLGRVVSWLVRLVGALIVSVRFQARCSSTSRQEVCLEEKRSEGVLAEALRQPHGVQSFRFRGRLV
ncbi:unnamed protein product, partial [Polarella glacialis]